MIQKNVKAYHAVKELVKNGKDFSHKEKASELGVHPRTIGKYVAKARRELNLQSIDRRVGKKDRRSKKAFVGGTLQDFRDQFDDSVVIPSAIEQGIKKHLMRADGTPLYMRDQDFREACDVGPGKWRRYADDYKHLQVKKDGAIYWGHPEIIDELRKAVNR